MWPADTFVDFDTGLNTAMRELRQGLNGDADEPRYVETLARRGYRFIGESAGPRPRRRAYRHSCKIRRLSGEVRVVPIRHPPAVEAVRPQRT